MEVMGRRFMFGWSEGKDLCLYQTSSIRPQSQNLNRKLNRGGKNISAGLLSRPLLAPQRILCTRFAECECARVIWFGFSPQFSPVDMVEIISLRQGGAATTRSFRGNSIFFFQSSLRSAKEINNTSSDDFSISFTRRSFSLEISAVPKQPDPDLAGALQPRRKSSSTAIREENSCSPARSNKILGDGLWNAKKSDSLEQRAVEKTNDPSIVLSYESQVLHTALVRSHRAAGSSSSTESSSSSVGSSPFTTHRKPLRASTQNNLSGVPKLKSGGGPSSFTAHKSNSAGRNLGPSEASSTGSAKYFQSVRNREEYARTTDATEMFSIPELVPSGEESPRRIANSSASMGISKVNFPSSSTTAQSSEKIEQTPSQKRLQSASRSPRSSRKDRGQAFPSSESLDRLHQQLEEQAKENSSKAISQKPLGPEESARLRERLKEQKEKSIQEIRRRLFQNRRRDGQGDEFSCAVEPDSLILGEFVVHKRVGVGKYIGMKTEIPPGKANPSMYIYLQYADGIAKLKAKQAHRLLYRYHLPGDVGGTPSLSKLKDPRSWEKKKNKGKIAIQKMVINMMELYIHRLKQSRHPYPRNPVAMAKFAAKFPHTPTPDQLQAFADVERDMTELDLPMDRLICGDVGFGKTEVALRALFIAVEAGKQVMVLTPSTVLAKQHYETVRDRFASFPGVKVALLCRFQKESQRKDLIAGIHDGSLNVVVGTHSLLGNQIRYNNLGLLVIDEEQRFGVKQKEKITCLKTSVDVLTLSATPIPRTLYLAMSGFRDASLLTTPPPERRPIQTHLVEYNEEQVRKAIQFELDRGGQVFYVVPKVKGIDMLQMTLQSHFPDVEVAIAHGKQSASVLEESMERFCEGETKILLCTNIIESGLDIRMVNTIIVEDVHLFGLAQLYQLRGRVGRAQREAYAYLLHPHKALLTDEALERLVALQDCCDLGQGFQLAERDMAIRGIGSLFGEQQSGDAAKIGTDLYFEMLLDGLSKVDSQRLPAVQYEDFQMDLGVDTHIPSEYIKIPEEREAAIRAAENAARESLRTLVVFTNRLRDKYGKEPASMELAMKYLSIMFSHTGTSCPFHKRAVNEKATEQSLEDYKKAHMTFVPRQMLLKTIYVRRMAADLGINRIRMQGTSVLMETNMTVDAFEIIKTSIPSDSVQSSLTFENGRIEMQGLIGLPKERQLERVFCCLADMFNGLPSFVKYI